MKKIEICCYCGDEYHPTRRGAQKFCSNSCRSLNWRKKKELERSAKEVLKPANEALEKNNVPAPSEKMSWAGVGNAATGVAVVELAKEVFTPELNKPATKKDIQEIKMLIQSRYLLIKNIRKDTHGRSAYYDVQTGYVVHK